MMCCIVFITSFNDPRDERLAKLEPMEPAEHRLPLRAHGPVTINRPSKMIKWSLDLKMLRDKARSATREFGYNFEDKLDQSSPSPRRLMKSIRTRIDIIFVIVFQQQAASGPLVVAQFATFVFLRQTPMTFASCQYHRIARLDDDIEY